MTAYQLPSEQAHTILQVVVGSTVHGTAVQDGLEDLDLMAVVVEPIASIVGLHQRDTWVHRNKPAGMRSEVGDTDFVAYGLRKYLSLAMRGNPSILLALFVPKEFRQVDTQTAQELRELAPSIVSRAAIGPYRGYVKQQRERLFGTRGQKNVTRPELVERYGYDTKYAAHVVRLALQGQEILRTGRITLPMPIEQREVVIGVRRGAYSFASIELLIEAQEVQLQKACEESTLPVEPDRALIEQWMIQTYMSVWYYFNKERE